eukprot:TRINITY_DN673_c0_g1_i2.p1 TRINITY_DN673_c0_g1~~TRINITY_DN673_c0_g1_i2.p1  ORF type:complete len:333 (-),score=48.51 TRINITY_DN673_c0_g1_i2:33-1031(-)
MGIWKGKDGWEYPAEFNLNVLKLGVEVELFITKLAENYKYHDQNYPWSTIGKFLYPSLGEYYNSSMKQFIDVKSLPLNFSKTHIIPITRTIYDQELSMNVFSGLTSLVPIVTESFTVKQGNSFLVEKLFKNSSANVNLKTTVTKISKLSNGLYEVSHKVKENYDAVFMATPYENSNGLVLENMDNPITHKREYKHWYVTIFVAKTLNSTYFKVDPVPDVIFTTSGYDDLPFVTLSFRGQTKSGKQVFKTFSNKPISDETMGMIFCDVSYKTEQHWPLTFPDFSPIKYDEMQPFLVDKHFFYLNSIESVATAMEASAMAAKNGANLLKMIWKS